MIEEIMVKSILSVICFIMALILLLFSIKPELWVKWTLKMSQVSVKSWGYKGKLESTPKAIRIIRFWSIVGFLFWLIAAIMVLKVLK